MPARLVAAILALAAALVLIPGHDSARAAPEITTPPPVKPGALVWVAETGQTVRGAFLSWWLAHPGAGLPVTSAIEASGRWVQWFEYAQVELDPVPFDEAAAANVHPVLLGQKVAHRLGYDRLPAFQPQPPGPDRFFPETSHNLRAGFLTAWERDGLGQRLGFPISDEFAIGATAYQFFERGALTWTPDQGVGQLPLGQIDARLTGHATPPVPQPRDAVRYDPGDPWSVVPVLAGERWIEVDLSDHVLIAWVGNVEVLRAPVVTGSPYSPTPTGDFRIYLRNRVQSLSGIGWDGYPYYEANVPWVMYFYQDFAIHGTTWRTTFGYADSQGCVIPPNEVTEKIWSFTDHGTRVSVHE